MKYMAPQGFQSNPLMRLSLLLCLLVLAALWATNLTLYLTRLGLDPQTVVAHFRGSEEEFIQPRTVGSMLEVTHAHLATMTVVVLLLTHLAVFLPWDRRIRIALVVAPFGSLLLGETAGWLVRFVHPGFAWLKIGMFLLFQLALAVLIGSLASLIARGNGDRSPRDSSRG